MNKNEVIAAWSMLAFIAIVLFCGHFLTVSCLDYGEIFGKGCIAESYSEAMPISVLLIIGLLFVAAAFSGAAFLLLALLISTLHLIVKRKELP